MLIKMRISCCLRRLKQYIISSHLLVNTVLEKLSFSSVRVYKFYTHIYYMHNVPYIQTCNSKFSVG